MQLELVLAVAVSVLGQVWLEAAQILAAPLQPQILAELVLVEAAVVSVQAAAVSVQGQV